MDCAYCGQPATDREHVVPRSYLNMVRSIDALERTDIVPACSECNSIAGTKVFSSFVEKRKFIRGELVRRHHKLLTMPHWSERELAELQPLLRRHVEASLAHRERLIARIGFTPKVPGIELPRLKDPEAKRVPSRGAARPLALLPVKRWWMGDLAMIAQTARTAREVAEERLGRRPSHGEVLSTAARLRALAARGACVRDRGVWTITANGRELLAGWSPLREAVRG